MPSDSTARRTRSTHYVSIHSALANYTPPIDPANSDAEDEKEEEHLGRIPVIGKALRSFRELEHACNFFIATTYHQIKENELANSEAEEYHRLEKLEMDWYQKAKVIRRELLKESKVRAQRQMNKIDSKKPFHHMPIIKDLPDYGGIETRKFLIMIFSMRRRNSFKSGA
jgi:E3 ubiquitin-protein ligase SHPRH